MQQQLSTEIKKLAQVEEADWSREKPTRFWDPSKKLLAAIRQYQKLTQKGGPLVKIFRARWVLAHRFWSVVTGADIPLNSQIGGGLLMPHPNGIVIHPAAVVGNNCLFFQQVTLGTQGDGVPVLGDHVDVGAGAKILGGVTIGAFAKIGANAVVISDVPAGATAVGIPAKIIAKN